MFKIGNIELENNVVLAPMAGICNSAFRRIIKEMDCGLLYAEMVSDKALVYDNERTVEMLYMTEEERPIAQQIFGSDKDSFVKAAKIIEEKMRPDIIDINMGCPVPKVALRAQAGSALLKSPDKVYEKAGASAITVHPRTRSQGYLGKANWNIIKEVKENVSIPVIGNGDIVTPEDAKKMIDLTGCDAVMIGRGCLGNPYLIKETVHYLKTGQLLPKEDYISKMDICLKHYEYLLKIKPEKVATLEMRTHAAYYLKGLPNAVKVKQMLYAIKNKEEFINTIENYKKVLKNKEK